jgi:hypothetical protein
MVVVQQSAEARPTGDLAICPVVIRRTDVPDELATNALVEPLGHIVLDEFLDQVPQMALARFNLRISANFWENLGDDFPDTKGAGLNFFNVAPGVGVEIFFTPRLALGLEGAVSSDGGFGGLHFRSAMGD